MRRSWISPTIVVLVALIPAAVRRQPAPPAASAAAPGMVMPGKDMFGKVMSGCPRSVVLTDPQSVARSVVAWLLCGSGPPGVLSFHAEQVLGRWSSLARPAPMFAITDLGLVDPRSAPVTVRAEVERPAGNLSIVLMLFRSPDGAWFADDLFVASAP